MNNNINNEERKNNSGQGIFYAVIGVATLVVTIIGATFAFFSATTNSAPNAVNTTSATVSLGFTPVDTGLKGDLIPVDETLSRFATVAGIGSSECKDDNGNNICSVYTFTVSNPSPTAAQRIYVYLTPGVNEFVNLRYAVFKGDDNAIKGKTAVKYDVDGTAVTTGSDTAAHVVGTNGDLVVSNGTLTCNSTEAIELEPLEQVLPASSSVTYTIVLWLHETVHDQSDSSLARCAVGTGAKEGNTYESSGAKFAATVNVTTAGGGTGVTGVLAVN